MILFSKVLRKMKNRPKFLGFINLKHAFRIFLSSIIVFAVIYWWLGPKHFYNDDTTDVRKTRGWAPRSVTDLTFPSLLYFSTMIQCVNSVGDIIPISTTSRALVSLQTLISLYLLLNVSTNACN